MNSTRLVEIRSWDDKPRIVDDLDCNRLEIRSSGSGSIVCRGRSSDVRIHASGSSVIDASGVTAERVLVHASGSGRIEIYSDGAVDIHSSGSGSIWIGGSGEVRILMNSGNASIVQGLYDESSWLKP